MLVNNKRGAGISGRDANGNGTHNVQSVSSRSYHFCDIRRRTKYADVAHEACKRRGRTGGTQISVNRRRVRLTIWSPFEQRRAHLEIYDEECICTTGGQGHENRSKKVMCERAHMKFVKAGISCYRESTILCLQEFNGYILIRPFAHSLADKWNPDNSFTADCSLAIVRDGHLVPILTSMASNDLWQSICSVYPRLVNILLYEGKVILLNFLIFVYFITFVHQ